MPSEDDDDEVDDVAKQYSSMLAKAVIPDMDSANACVNSGSMFIAMLLLLLLVPSRVCSANLHMHITPSLSPVIKLPRSRFSLSTTHTSTPFLWPHRFCCCFFAL